jgi:hypothetical protein
MHELDKKDSFLGRLYVALDRQLHISSQQSRNIFSVKGKFVSMHPVDETGSWSAAYWMGAVTPQ